MENEMNKKIEDKNNERGLAAIEYVILAAFLIASIVVGVKYLSPRVENAFKNVGDQLDTARPDQPAS
jgi:Flp pilus assembly pilin Flp